MPETSDIFFEAVAFAAKAHHTQRRKASTDPYLAHVLRVAYLAIDAKLSDGAAAVLHDVVEDTPIEIHEIYEKFPYDTARAVHLLTKWWPDDTSADDKTINMAFYYDGILTNMDAINIKLLDRHDNLRDMLLLLPQKTSWVKKYLRKTEDEFERIYAASDNVMIQELFRGTVALVRQKLAQLEAK